MSTIEMAQLAKIASITLSAMSADQKNKALLAIAQQIDARRNEIIVANNQDLDQSRIDQIAEPLLKRLKFDDNKINDVIEGIKSLVTLPDPVGKTLLSTELDDGLELYKVTCPIGVIGIIFESRPDALVQISTLCLKSGNSVILKGGSEAKRTNRILADIISAATEQVEIPKGWISILETRAEVGELLKLDDFIDLIIPRGSNEFVRYIMENTKIPVLGHADGICHCYVDKEADLEMAIQVVVDSKTQSIAVCNATETLLVHSDVADDFLPQLKDAMTKKNVTLLGCENTRKIIDIKEASEKDWKTEYLDTILSIKMVNNLEEAIQHINRYGSGHTDCIITNNSSNAKVFMDLVDSGNVFLNCSTRFSDGFKYGFGAEVGISTTKIHSRGPVGLEGLIIYKYKLIGKGHIVDDYAKKTKTFKHRNLNTESPL